MVHDHLLIPSNLASVGGLSRGRASVPSFSPFEVAVKVVTVLRREATVKSKVMFDCSTYDAVCV